MLGSIFYSFEMILVSHYLQHLILELIVDLANILFLGIIENKNYMNTFIGQRSEKSHSYSFSNRLQ